MGERSKNTMNAKQQFAPLAASLGAVAAFALTAAAASADIGVTVNGSAVDVEPAPIVQAGRVFVPLRGVFEQLGASVVYDNGTINATGNGRDITLQIGSTQATVNGQSQVVDVAPFIVGASTYVPLRFISESLGDSVNWDKADQIAAIDSGGGASDYYAPGTASYVDTAPPPIPQYDQPAVPVENDVWQPGYWAWGSYGYYWVPGTWIAAPQPGYLWTPGYWQGSDVGFHFIPGYWAAAVGFYGGVNYGHGYFGNGYDGGRWSRNVFNYNTYVTHVNTTIIRNVYINRNVYVNNDTTVRNGGYNGGRYGLTARPTTQQLAVARGRHIGMTQVQQLHVRTAEGDRQLLATVNHDKPPVIAVAHPLSANNRPAGFAPVRATERVDPQAHVAPVRVTTVRRTLPIGRPVVARPVEATRPVVTRPATIAHPEAARPQAAAHSVVARPAETAHPVVAQPADVSRPIVRRPTEVAHPVAARPVEVAQPVAKPVPARAPVIHEPAPAERAAAQPETAPRRTPAVYAAQPRVAPAPAYHAAPAPAPAFHAAPAMQQARPAAPQARPAMEARPAMQQARPAAPQARPAAAQQKGPPHEGGQPHR